MNTNLDITAYYLLIVGSVLQLYRRSYAVRSAFLATATLLFVSYHAMYDPRSKPTFSQHCVSMVYVAFL